MTGEAQAGAAPPHRRHLKNYLLDKSYQLRYTAVIVLISAALTAGLGFLVVSKAQEATRTIEPGLALLDEDTAARVKADLRAGDRNILLAIVGFGVLFCLAMMGYGIVITHKVAGPLYKISTYFHGIRDGKLGKIYELRRGDQLHGFYEGFKEMHASLVQRTQADIQALEKAIAALEKIEGEGAKAALENLRTLKKQKEDFLS